MRKVAFVPAAFDDFNSWLAADRKMHKRVIDLIKDIQRNPFNGLGKPLCPLYLILNHPSMEKFPILAYLSTETLQK